MKREIKFRVWNGHKMEKNIMAGFLGAFYVQGIDKKDTACMSPFNTKYHEETDCMQYTGLKDKEGKEIYDGDILRINEDVCSIKYSDEMKILIAYFPSKTSNNWKHIEEIGWDSNFTEIIGNIYENPELLTTQAGGV